MRNAVCLAEKDEFRSKLRAIVGSYDKWPPVFRKPRFQMGEHVSSSPVGELCCPSVGKEIQAYAAHGLHGI